MAEQFASKYRPHTFADVVGQDVAKATLKNIALAEGIVVRSIFLKGSWGSGKTTCARIFARALNCTEFKKTGDVCNECDSCKEVSSPNSQLYFEFDASVVGNIDSIRALREKLSYLPQGRRLVVIDECHAASSAALNALLKIVEDGVPNTIFCFCSTEDILPTIKSRSLCIDITTIPQALMMERLREVCQKEEISAPDEILYQICQKSGGHMRDAMSILQLYSIAGPESLKTSFKLLVKFFTAALTKHPEAARELLHEIELFPTIDIKSSIYQILRASYNASESDELYQFKKSGIVNTLFGYFFTPVAQQALKDEVGTSLLLQAFIEKACK